MRRWPRGPSSCIAHRLAAARRCLFRGAALAGLTLAFLSAGATAQEQSGAEPETEITPGDETFSEGDRLALGPGRLPRNAYVMDEPNGFKTRGLFRDTHAPFRESGQAFADSPLTGYVREDFGFATPVTGFRTNASLREPIPLEGSEGISSSVDLLGLRIGAGLGGSHGLNILGHGFEPNDADLKVGPLFFKLRVLSGSLLASDNINATETNREAGTIAIVQLAGTIVAQLTESLRVSGSARLIYLPFKGKVGVVADSGIYDFTLGGGGRSRFPIAQIDWDGRIAGWDVFVTDTFFADFEGGALGFRSTFEEELFEGPRFDEVDQAGRYRFGGTFGIRRGGDRDFETRDNDGRGEDIDLNSYGNRLDVGASRLLPGPVRLQVRAYREDLWYNQGDRGLPSIREGGSIYASSERPNMRFNPFALYAISRNDLDPEWDQRIIGGLRGPITDQLHLQLYAGEFIDGATDQSRFIAGLRLFHLAGPFTYESLFIGREVDDYFAHSEEVDRISYHLHQVLGPRLFADAFASYEESRPIDDSGFSRTGLLAGLRLSAILGPRTHAIFSYVYYRSLANHPSFLFSGEDRFDDARDEGDAEYISQTIRLSLGYRFTDSIRGSLTYEFRDIDTSVPGRSYYENLVVLSLAKYFY